MNPLALAETLLAQGEESRARDIVLKHRLLSAQTPEEYVAWGRLCEELALPQQALECYQKALSVSPNEPLALRALGLLQFELGDFEAARRLLRRYLALDPEDEETRKALGNIYLALGEKGSYQALFPGKTRPRLKIKGPRLFPREFGQGDLEPFIPFLTGRPGYAEIILNDYGQARFQFHDAPLDYELLRAHLKGERYLCFFPISHDLKQKVASLQIFFPLRILRRQAREENFLRAKQELCLYIATRALRKLRAMGIPCVLERLSPWGYRFWFILKEPLHFLTVKRFLRALEEKLPYPEGGVRYDSWVFTAPRGLDWQEVAVPLPLGVHPTTRQRSLLIDDEGEPVVNPLLSFKKLREISTNEVKSICRGKGPNWQEPERPELLAKLFDSCPVLKAIVSKAEAGRKLTREEKLALFLTIGLLDQEGSLLHQVLYPTPDYRYSRVERQRKGLPPNPISCYKLREWFPDLAAVYSCHCVFEKDIRYPSPVLHVAPSLVPPEEPLTLEHLGPKELARRYVFYLQEKERLEEKITLIKRELTLYLSQKTGKKLSAGNYYVELKDGELTVKKP